MVTSTNGVRSWLDMPPSASDVAGFSNDPSGYFASVADVYLYNQNDHSSSAGFVQFGWYVGYGGPDLPYVSFPHIFWGENTGSGERLYAPNVGLNYGTSHTFKIYESSAAGYYYFSLDNNNRGLTSGEHDYLNDAAFTGETDSSSVAMDGIAQNNGAPLNTLEYQASGHWQYFPGGPSGYFGQPDFGYRSYRISGIDDTDHAFGPGN